MISLELHLFLGLFFEGFREVNGMHLRHAQAGERGPADACKQTNPPPRVARRPRRHTSPTRELCQVNMETAERLKKVASTFSDEEEAGEEHETQRRCGLGSPLHTLKRVSTPPSPANDPFLLALILRCARPAPPPQSPAR